MTDLQQVIDEALEDDRYRNGAIVGERERCDNCGCMTLECVSNAEDAETGVHDWCFRCSTCGFEAGERW